MSLLVYHKMWEFKLFSVGSDISLMLHDQRYPNQQAACETKSPEQKPLNKNIWNNNHRGLWKGSTPPDKSNIFNLIPALNPFLNLAFC